MMVPQNETGAEVDVKASPPMLANGICACIAGIISKGGKIVAIVPAGFMRQDGLVLPNQAAGTIDVQRIFWIEPHEKQPRDPETGELRIGNNGFPRTE